MKLEEAIERLSKFANIEILYGKHLSITTSQQHDIKEAINTSLQHIKHLQKENQELKNERNGYRAQVNSAFDNGFIHKDKIREMIEEIKNKPNNPNQKVIATQIDASLIALLHDLLKEEKEK